MWGKKNTDSMSALDESAKHETAWLGSGLQVKGEITGTEDLQIDGAVEGLIHLDERKLTVGEKAIQVQVGARGPWFFSKLLLMSKRNVLRSPFLLLTV